MKEANKKAGIDMEFLLKLALWMVVFALGIYGIRYLFTHIPKA